MKNIIDSIFTKKNAPKIGFVAAFLLVLAIMPFMTTNAYVIHVLLLCMLYSCVASSWNLIAGFAGVFNFGYQALWGIGAYVSALTSMKLGVSPWIGMFLGGFSAMLIGIVIATPCIKLKKIPYICIATMSMGEIVRLVVKNTPNLTRGEQGLIGIPEMFASGQSVYYYYLVLAVFVIVTAVLVLIVNSPMGMSLSAIKGSQEAAESLGIDVSGTKIKIYMIGAFIAGMMGSIYAHYVGVLTPSTALVATFMTQIVAMTLIGGIGTIVGPILGSFLITGGLEMLRSFSDYRLIVYSLLIIVTIIFMRKGVYGTLRDVVAHKMEQRKAAKN